MLQGIWVSLATMRPNLSEFWGKRFEASGQAPNNDCPVALLKNLHGDRWKIHRIFNRKCPSTHSAGGISSDRHLSFWVKCLIKSFMLGNLMYRPPIEWRFRFEDSILGGRRSSNMFWNVPPRNLGRWTHVDDVIFFKRGWFNHQPVLWFQDKRIVIPRIFSCSWVALK